MGVVQNNCPFDRERMRRGSAKELGGGLVGPGVLQGDFYICCDFRFSCNVSMDDVPI